MWGVTPYRLHVPDLGFIAWGEEYRENGGWRYEMDPDHPEVLQFSLYDNAVFFLTNKQSPCTAFVRILYERDSLMIVPPRQAEEVLKPPVYHYEGGCALGDSWVVTQWLLRQSAIQGSPALLSNRLPKFRDGGPSNMLALMPLIAVQLDSPGTFEFVDHPAGQTTRITSSREDLWTCPRMPTRTKWDGGSAGTICYQYDGRSIAEMKNPPTADLGRLQQWPNMHRVGLPLTMEESLAKLAACKLFIGVCSGMSHVAHAVGCPMILIEYKSPILRWHPPQGMWSRACGTSQAVEMVNVFLDSTT